MNATSRATTALLALTFLLATSAPLAAEPTVIKLATVVPDGSVWHKALLGTGSQWTQATQGRVTLRVYPGGVAGDEPDMVRRMRIGQLHASALTPIGLSEIDPAFKVFTIPMFFDDYDELRHVVSGLEPALKQRLEAKGFVLLNWGHAGWLYYFTKQPAATVAEFKRTKTWVWSGDDAMVQLWREVGFQPVPLAITDILTGLQTGMIEAMPVIPLGALTLQWFRITPYMTAVGMNPLVGALVVTRQAWNRIGEADRAALLEICHRAEKVLEKQIPGQDSSAIVEMQKRGLTVVKPKPEALAEWRSLSDAFAAKMRGAIVPGEVFDLAQRERAAWRKLH